MRKLLNLACLVVMFLGISIAPAGAWVYVYDPTFPEDPITDTGWQSYTYTNNTGAILNAYAGFVVSNDPIAAWDSQLFIDNLSQAGDNSNKSFGLGDFTGYTLVTGGVGSVGASFMAYGSGTTYYPTDPPNLAALNDPFTQNEKTGVGATAVTSAFINAYGQHGSTGSILLTPISLNPGESFSFDWNFCSGDLASTGARDFASFFLAGAADTSIILYQEGLGQLAPVPLPPALLLLGSGLLGLMAFRQKNKVK